MPFRTALLALTGGMLLTACAGARQSAPFLGAEPEPGATVNRAPQTLRLYFDALPDVSRSTVELTGPDSRQLNLRGLHTMGADDLMMEIYGEVPDGRYTVRWSTTVEGDPAQYQGSYQFTVDAEG